MLPATLAFGSISHGKTRAAEAARSIQTLLCEQDLRQAGKPAGVTVHPGVPTSSPGEFAGKVLIHFAKGSDSSCSASYEQKCTFTATLNMKCFEAFAAMPKRYGAIFVWFSTNIGHIHYFVKNDKAMIQYSDRSKAVRGSPMAPGDRLPTRT